MEECSLPKARPISCSVCPAFQRRHTSIFCSAESPNRFPGFINTTFKKQLYIRWCCIDRLNRHDLSGARRNRLLMSMCVTYVRLTSARTTSSWSRRKQPNRTKETDREEGNYPRRTV